MKKIFISFAMMILCSTMVFASKVDGKWKASIETDNGTFEFTVVYKVDGEKITGEFFSEYGNLAFGPGKMIGEKEFEYTFDIDYVKNTHKGKLVNDNEILIKSNNANGDEREIKLTKVVDK
jgi:hypothetical protein